MTRRNGVLAVVLGLTLCLSLAAQAELQIGDPAIEFTAYDVNGNPHSLSDFQGKTVLLNWWASW